MNDISRKNSVKTDDSGDNTISSEKGVIDKPMEVQASDKYDIGQCRRLKITCVSEVGWWSNDIMLRQIMSAPGKEKANQWSIPWDADNAAGSCSLVEVELLDGTKHKLLIDTGWDKGYMDEAFKREGIDKMLKNHEIEIPFHKP